LSGVILQGLKLANVLRIPKIEKLQARANVYREYTIRDSYPTPIGSTCIRN